jgi:pilus assembly protein CpaC
MILITPYIVHAVAQKMLSRPNDGFINPNDQSAVLLGKLNRVYGVPARSPKAAYHGNIGFIID